MQKGWLLCQEVTVQGLPAGVAEQAEAEARVKAGAGWVDHLKQGRAEIVSVQTAEQQSLMLSDSPVMQEVVLSVVRK